MSNDYLEAVKGGVFVTPLETRVGLYTETGDEAINSVRIPTDFKNAPEHMAQVAHTLRWLHGKVNPISEILGVGLAVAGEVNGPRTAITNASRLSYWRNQKIAEMLSNHLDGTKVVLGNDAEARTRWLAQNDPELQQKTFYALFLGEGIGGCRAKYAPGRQGHIFTPREPGHILVPGLSDKSKLPCLCGKRGCLDAHSSGHRIGNYLATSGRQWLHDAEWQAFAKPIVSVLERHLKANPVDAVVLGGQRLNRHPKLKEHLVNGLTETLPMRVTITSANLEFAPSHTAVTLLEHAMVGAL